MIAYVALVIAVIGLMLYLLSPNAKAAEIGRLLFFSGAITFTLTLGGHTVKLL